MTEFDDSPQEVPPTEPEVTPGSSSTSASPPTWAPGPPPEPRPWRDPGDTTAAEPTSAPWPPPAWGPQGTPPSAGGGPQQAPEGGTQQAPGGGHPGGPWGQGPTPPGGPWGYPGGSGYPPYGGPAGSGQWPGAWGGGGGWPSGGSAGGGWGGGNWGQQPGQAGGWGGWAPPRARRSLPPTVTALLLAVAVLVGLGIGHGVWTSKSAANGSGSNFGVPGGSTDPNFGNGSGNGTGFGSGGGSNGTGSSALTGPESAVASDLVDVNVSLSYQGDEAEGTGIVLTANGLVLTNNHVISGATSVSAVDIGNGKTYTATVVGYDRNQDVALIQLRGASGLQTAPIGNSNAVAVQEAVVGIGNAGGAGGAPSTATGQVTALGQTITAQDESTGSAEQLSGLIETNCDIQPGDSGGALVSSAGKVIGMDTAASVGFSFQTQGSQGYAIPINQAMTIANQIKNGQGSADVHLGSTAFMGVEIKAQSGVNGAYIATVIPGGPAQAAGLAANDVITAFGGSPVTSPDDLTKLISADHPGQTVQVTYTDQGGTSHTASLTLGSGPPQ